MFLNAMAREWKPPGAAAAPAPAETAPAVEEQSADWPASFVYQLFGHERQDVSPKDATGIIKCLQPAAAVGGRASNAQALQLMGSLGEEVRQTSKGKPCCTQGFFLSTRQLVGDGAGVSDGNAFCTAPGLLVPLAPQSGAREWGSLVELYKSLGTRTVTASDSILGIGFIAFRSTEFLAVIVPPNASSAELEALADRVRSTFQVPRATPFPSLLCTVCTVVSLPRASGLIVGHQEAPDAMSKAITATNDLVTSIHVGQHPAPLAIVVELACTTAFEESTAATVATTVLEQVGRQAAVKEPVVTLLAVSFGGAYPGGHKAAEALRLLLQLLNELGITPAVCFDARSATDELVTDADSTIPSQALLQRAATLKDMIAPRLWPSPVGVSIPMTLPQVFQQVFSPIPSLVENGRVVSTIRAALPPASAWSPARRRLLRHNFAEVAESIAQGEAWVRRTALGSSVLVVHVPALQPTLASRDPVPRRLYCCDPDVTVVGVLPPQVRSSVRSLPHSGVSAMVAVWSPSSLAPDQSKLVITDVLVWGGENMTGKRYRDRMEAIAPYVELDSCYNIRSPAGVALVRSENCSPEVAVDALLHTKTSSVDYNHVGITITVVKDTGLVEYAWTPPEAVSVVLGVSSVTSVHDRHGPEAVRRAQLVAATPSANLPYRGEYCDVAPETLHRVPEAGDALQLLCHVEPDGGHYWEPLRLFDPAELRAMLSSPFTDMTELYGSNTPAASGIMSHEDVDTIVSGCLLTAADVAFALTARENIYGGVITDKPELVADGAYVGLMAAAPDKSSIAGVSHAILPARQSRGAGQGLLTDKEARTALWTAVAGRDEHLRLTTTNSLPGRSESMTPPPQADASGAPPSYNAAAASMPSSLSLVWPVGAACATGVARSALSALHSQSTPNAVVVDLCCGHEAVVGHWLRDHNCLAYVAVDKCAVTVQHVEGRASALRGPPRVSTREETVLRPQPINHNVVRADAFEDQFWTRQLPNVLPDGCARASLIMCTRVMPMQRELARSEESAIKLMKHVASRLMPHGAFVFEYLDAESLIHADDAAGATELEARYTEQDPTGTVRVEFRRPGPLGGRGAEIPCIPTGRIAQAATAAGLTDGAKEFFGGEDATEVNVLRCAQMGLRGLTDIKMLPAGSPGALVSEDASWTDPLGGGGTAAIQPCLSVDTARLLAAMKVAVLRVAAA